MKNKEILEKTTNRKVFNYAYKEHLERTGKIRCVWCRYNKGENSTQDWYGGHWSDKFGNYDIKYPSWKLVSKNRKQWMKKPSKIEYKTYVRYGGYVITRADISW